MFEAISLGVTVLGSLFGSSAAKKQERAARRQGQEQARVERQVTRERLRQIERQEEIMRGQTIAGAAGQGVDVGSQSVLQVLADQEAEFRRELQVTETVGASRARGALQRAETLSDTYKYQGYASLFSGVMGVANIGKEAGWWGT